MFDKLIRCNMRIEMYGHLLLSYKFSSGTLLGIIQAIFSCKRGGVRGL